MFYKRKNFITKKKQNLNEIKEKYFIRGLALNKEYAFYYDECKQVDFLENEEKITGNKNIYNNIDSYNKNKFDYIKYNNENISEKSNKPKNNSKSKQYYKLRTKYSLKNLMNNKLPIIFTIQ